MDVIGDYAGTEPFVIDGDALLQVVLDDPLLAIGVEHECSFQILHARHILEQTILAFIQRKANFEIVFWNANRHATIHTGGTSFEMASRTLARTLLINHLKQLENLVIYTFEDLEDSGWLHYETTQKPMFIMTNDGGALANGAQYDARLVVLQREFVFRVLCHGTAVILLKGADYHDTKILSFVHEQRRSRNQGDILSKDFYQAISQIRQSLNCISPGTITRLPRFTNLIAMVIGSYLPRAPPGIPSEILYLFIAHCLILPSLSVQDRARPADALNAELNDIVTNKFLPAMLFTINDVISPLQMAFDLDGRIFSSLIRFIVSKSTSVLAQLIGQAICDGVEEIFSFLGVSGPVLNLPRFAAHYPLPPLLASTLACQNEPSDIKSFRLLAFNNSVINDSLAELSVQTSTTEESEPQSPAHLDFGQIFADTQHWHNQKSLLPSHLGGPKPKAKDERQHRRELRSNQRFMATLQRQAATLTGAAGATLKQIAIAPVGSQTSTNLNKTRVKLQIKETKEKGKATKLSSAEKLRKKIHEQRSTTEQDASQKWWSAQLALLNDLSLDHRIEKMKALCRNRRLDEKVIGLEMRLYCIHLELLKWINEDNPDSSSINDQYTLSILRMIKDICDTGFVSSTASKILTTLLNVMGFGKYAERLLNCNSREDSVVDFPLSFDFVKLVKSKSKGQPPRYLFMAIREDPVIWQLRLFGEYMDRSMDSAVDQRVAFHPDAWQRLVLDSIDEEKSMLIVAPTSAGKTFISFYAMEKVLRGSDNGVIVYIAPTKALVTQIAAEIYARFSKDLNGKSCWAIHTRDYRVNDPQNCQILVTVPEVLAIMLLSPALARVWTPRLKRIILDEIHSIGQQEGGAVWEQIILLAPCPVIGLSATIGSPETFNEWLKTVQNAHGFEHIFIQHPHRYSHLRKSFYVFSGNPRFECLETYKTTSRIRLLHPISLLSFGARSLPEDLALEARDTYTLYQALGSQKASNQSDLASLEPTVFFSSNSHLLRQMDIIRYEASLKSVISRLILHPESQEPSSSLHRIIQHLKDDQISATPEEVLNTSPSRDLFKGNLPFLLADLHVQNELPAILFNFDRSDCEIMAAYIVHFLETSEAHWRESNPEWNRKIRQWEIWCSRSKERERLAARTNRQKKDDESHEDSSQRTWESTFDPDHPSPQFSFAGTHTSYSKSELDQDIEEISRWTNTPTWALLALRRGVAVHHSGMNKRYRSLVESLFRQGFVRIVIATGTLALGINAPAKTTVFCGDSPFLTALMYRQCAGRAGRRGYDLLGNVIFYGLPMDRVQRLILSRLPSISGNFPLTSTLTLRLFNLLDGSKYAPVAVKAVQSILSLPHISFGSETGQEQLRHHLRFSIEYLRQSRLLTENGEPMNLFAVAAHLYYTEPSNFALVAVLRKGALHTICTQSKGLEAKKQDFMLLMCHLFGRRYFSKVFGDEKHIKMLTQKYPSTVVLPPLQDNVREILAKHESEILRIFTAYALAYATTNESGVGRDCQLPLSGQTFSGLALDEASQFHAYLKTTSIRTEVRSAFVANSGHSDDFTSISELVTTARRGLHLNGHAIPSMERILASSHSTPGEGGLEHVLNGYLLDFYTHGQVATLAAANGIRRGDVWYLLQDFTLILATIKAALEQLLLRVSKRSSVRDDSDEEDTDIDLDRVIVDTNEVDQVDIAEPGESDFKRPLGVQDIDWKVYELVRSVSVEFEKKFKAMWA
ncbi:hypothetical protein BDQ12DRAFT_684235 [Crucibulum laeve]|uniref:P-loop containing nucleoside triphosphate hydrolase protein n=1 Tax=Crucibulum laeve TaxID=68775 RepID=A0A5C3LYR4_9AGAR|nr:hypothetical protein BDQ12DRAFT_684235 [Crucibulum laeve]